MQTVAPTDAAGVQKDKLGLAQLVHRGEARNGYLYLRPSPEDTPDIKLSFTLRARKVYTNPATGKR